MVTVTISGREVTRLVDIDTTGRVDNLGRATIIVVATETNKQIASGDRVLVERATGDDWTGYVTGKPNRFGNGTLRIEALDSRYELKQLNVHRPFYDMDDGAIVREAVAMSATTLGREFLHDGTGSSDIDDWTGNVPYLSAAGLDDKQLHERGNGLVFAGLTEGSTGTYQVIYEGIDQDITPGGGQVASLKTRLLVNDPGEQIAVQVEFRDSQGVGYVWDVPRRPGFQTVDLPAEEASTGGQLTTNATLAYRFDLSGALTDNVGVVIDWADLFPFALEARNTPIDVGAVEDSGRSITRRVDGSVLSLVQDLQTDIGFTSWIDGSDTLHFEQAGGDGPALDIVRGETAVIGHEFDTQFDQIVNEVLVQGAGDVQATVRDPASIDFYGVAPRSESIVDETIQTFREAQDRGRGSLRQHAWNDTVVTFVIADASYQQLQRGDRVRVDWPPQDLDETLIVRSASVDRSGLVTLELGVRI